MRNKEIPPQQRGYNALFTDGVAISLYNSDLQELIGVFHNIFVASRYVYPNTKADERNTKVYNAFIKKETKITDSKRVNCSIAVRAATTEKKALLEHEYYYISPEYPKPSEGDIQGFKIDSIKRISSIL